MSEFVFELLQLAGILAFAISGALVGVRRNLDMLGVAAAAPAAPPAPSADNPTGIKF